AGGPGSLAMQPAEPGFSTDGLPRAFLQSLRTLFDILDEAGRGEVGEHPGVMWGTRGVPWGARSCRRGAAVCVPAAGCVFNGPLAVYKAISPSGCLNCGAAKYSSPAPLPFPPDHTAVLCLTCRSTVFTGVLLELSDGRCQLAPSSGNAVYRQSSLLRPCPASLCWFGHSAVPPAQPLRPCSAEGGVLPRSQSETATGLAGARRHGRSRDEQRRHTITSGVDYGMLTPLKQMKELEQEKDSLLAGLELLERARDWYQQQIHSVTERQRLVGQSAHSTEFLAESGQSRLGVLLPRLQEVTRCLGELLSCPAGSDRCRVRNGLYEDLSFPIFHCFLGSSSVCIRNNTDPAPPPAGGTEAEGSESAADQVLTPATGGCRYKCAPRVTRAAPLSQEVTEKSERITQLEQEKSALIKQLFEARARGSQEGGALDSTFI
uniref:Suppressor APC domain containing 2 n=1 Tax=Lepisosteus oculatus TaxID=7918 RepID=W5LYM7_LEPOC